MVGVKSQDADSLLARLAPDVSVILIFGTDPGLVSERIRLAIKSLGIDTADPFQTTRLDGTEIASDQAKLLDETNTLGLFNAARAILIDAGSIDFSPALEIALQEVRTDLKIVIEGGALKKDSPLRKLCERHRFAVAIECNPDNEIDLARLVDAEVNAANISLDRDTKNLILKSLGSDRLSTRSELEKLLTYAHGASSLSIDDVECVLSDASTVALENTIHFVFSGDMIGIENSWKRLLSAGTDGSTVLASALREAMALHQYCAANDRGGSSDQTWLRYNRAFGRKPLQPEKLRTWTLEKATRALNILTLAFGPSRRDPALGRELAIRALWSVSYLVQR